MSQSRILPFISFFFTYNLCYCLFGEVHAANSWNYRYFETQKTKFFFNKNLEPELIRFASQADGLLDLIASDYNIKHNKKKYNIVIDNHSMVSNGSTFFGNAVFYSLDSQSNGTADWLMHLFIHEGRHLVQFSNIFGWSFVPRNTLQAAWYMEGDAVYAETRIGRGGRGHNPVFLRAYKAQLLSGKYLPFSKHHLGFMKDKSMDYYSLGYLLVTYIRHKYGEDFFKKVFSEESFIVKSLLSYRIKSFTGLSISCMYDDMNNTLRDLWSQQQSKLPITAFEELYVDSSGEWVNYYYPKIDSQGGCFVIRSSLDTSMCIAKVGTESITEVLQVNSNDMKTNGFSLAASTLAFLQCDNSFWRGIKNDSYNVIYLYDLFKKKISIINHKARYSSVDLSPDAKRLVVVENAPDYKNSLNIIDTKSKKILDKFYTIENRSIRQPKWANDGQRIVAIATYRGVSNFLILDTSSGAIEYIEPFSESDFISHPVLHDNTIFFNSTYGGIERICAIDLSTQKKYQVICSKFGAFNPFIDADNQWIYFNNFTDNGTKISRAKYDPSTWVELCDVFVDDTNYFYNIESIDPSSSSDLFADNPPKTKSYSVVESMLSNCYIDFLASAENSWDNKGFYPIFKMEDVLEFCSFSAGGMYDFADKLFLGQNRINYKELPINIDLLLKYHFLLDYNCYLRKHATMVDYLKDFASLAFDFPINYNYLDKWLILSLGSVSKIAHEVFSDNTWVLQVYSVVLSNSSTEGIVRKFFENFAQSVVVKYAHMPYHNMKNRDLSTNKEQPGIGFLCGVKFVFPGLDRYDSLLLKGSYQFVSSKRIEILESLSSVLNDSAMRELFLKRYRSLRAVAEYYWPLFYIDSGFDSYVFFERLWGLLGCEYVYNIENRTDFVKNILAFHAGCVVSLNFAALSKINLGIRMRYVLPYLKKSNPEGSITFMLVMNNELPLF